MKTSINKPREFIIADLHKGHKNIIKYESRPFESVQAMDDYLRISWNSKIQANDTVYICGDISFSSKTSTVEWLRELNGRKILVMGNHDKELGKPGWWTQTGLFEQVSAHPIVIRDNVILSHEPMKLDPSLPFMNLYGHVHGSSAYPDFTSNTACISVERPIVNYVPCLIDEVIEKIMEYQIIPEFAFTAQERSIKNTDPLKSVQLVNTILYEFLEELHVLLDTAGLVRTDNSELVTRAANTADSDTQTVYIFEFRGVVEKEKYLIVQVVSDQVGFSIIIKLLDSAPIDKEYYKGVIINSNNITDWTIFTPSEIFIKYIKPHL